MSIFDVGVENLPNVYISKIVMSSEEIKVTCVIKDNKERKSWKDRPQMSDMYVKLLLVNDNAPGVYASVTTGLNDGSDSLFNYRNTQPGYVVKKEAASAFQLQSQQDPTLEEDFYFKTFTFSKWAYQGASDVVVYAACYIRGLQFENDEFNKFYGPLTSEYIYRAGQLSEVSGYFYFPKTNKEYGGPVHWHNGKYMEGSSHRDMGHEEVIYVSENNAKLLET